MILRGWNQHLFINEWNEHKGKAIITALIIMIPFLWSFYVLVTEPYTAITLPYFIGGDLGVLLADFPQGIPLLDSVYYVMEQIPTLLFIVAIGITFFGSSLFAKGRRKKTLEFALALPMTRRQIVINKWLFGVLVIVIAHVLTTILFTLLSFVERVHITQYEIWALFVNVLPVYLLIFSLAFVVSVICNYATLSFVSAVMVMYSPVIFIVGTQFIYEHIERLINLINGLHVIQHEAIKWITLPHYLIPIEERYPFLTDYLRWTFLWIETIVMLVLTVVLLGFSIIFFNRNSVDRNKRLFQFKWATALFLLGVITIVAVLFGQMYSVY